jgi:RHS repeat-associated protein
MQNVKETVQLPAPSVLRSESGPSYYRARYYDPSVGRFISEDPARFGGGNNFYSYVHNRPLNLSDPKGLFAWGGGVAVTAMGGVLEIGGGVRGGSVGAQSVMLLHELGHTLGLIPPDGRAATAAGFPPNQSQINTQTILNNCLKAINAALRGF